MPHQWRSEGMLSKLSLEETFFQGSQKDRQRIAKGWKRIIILYHPLSIRLLSVTHPLSIHSRFSAQEVNVDSLEKKINS